MFGRELIRVHNWLRQSLDQLREELGSAAHHPVIQARTLQAHCIGFCSAVTRHHTGEDREAFPALAEQVPELRSVLEELARDHQLVADILRRVEELVSGLDAGDLEQERLNQGPIEPAQGVRLQVQRVRSELDGLAAILESHFRWAERRIVDALDALVVPGKTGKTAVELSGMAARDPRAEAD